LKLDTRLPIGIRRLYKLLRIISSYHVSQELITLLNPQLQSVWHSDSPLIRINSHCRELKLLQV